jgi:hypothetical protein
MFSKNCDQGSFLTGFTTSVHLLDIFFIRKAEFKTISKGLALGFPSEWVP